MKKLLVLVFAIALCLGVLCLGASAANEHGEHSDWNELTADMLKENNYTLEPGNYYLSEDVTCTGPITVTGNSVIALSDEFTICLNGHVLDLSGHYIHEKLQGFCVFTQ